MKVTDEKLSAYIDGELPPEETRSLDVQISEDAELAERVRKLRAINDALISVTSDVLDAPLPEHIVNLIQSDAEEQSSNVVQFQRSGQKSWFESPLAVAAAALFGLVLGGFFTLGPDMGERSEIYAGVVDSKSALHRALETFPSLSAESEFVPALTFRARNGDVCREIESSDSRALACRSSDRWTVLAVTYKEQKKSSSAYTTASADTSIVFDVLAQEMMQGAPLSADEERALIDQNWSINSPSNAPK